MLKKGLIVFLLTQTLLIGSTSSYANPLRLHTFESVQDAINDGYNLNFIINISDCKNQSAHNIIPNMIAAFKPSEIINIKNKKITASSMHFTLNNPEYKNMPVYEFINYQLLPSGKFYLSSTVLSADKQQLLSDPRNFECNLNTNAKIVTN